MPAPKRPNTAAATAAVVRRGQETMARKLRAGGWLVVAPEVLERQPIYICDAIEDIDERPCVRGCKWNCGHPYSASS